MRLKLVRLSEYSLYSNSFRPDRRLFRYWVLGIVNGLSCLDIIEHISPRKMKPANIDRDLLAFFYKFPVSQPWLAVKGANNFSLLENNQLARDFYCLANKRRLNAVELRV